MCPRSTSSIALTVYGGPAPGATRRAHEQLPGTTQFGERLIGQQARFLELGRNAFPQVRDQLPGKGDRDSERESEQQCGDTNPRKVPRVRLGRQRWIIDLRDERRVAHFIDLRLLEGRRQCRVELVAQRHFALEPILL